MTTPLHSADILDDFVLPHQVEAARPPKIRGIDRDQVRLMVVDATAVRHRRFHDLTDELEPGDLVVINNSRTIPAAVDIDETMVVHFSTELPGGLRVVEVRHRTSVGSKPNLSMSPGAIDLPGGMRLELLAPFPVDSPTKRLWVAHLDGGEDLVRLLQRVGRPITYSHPFGQIPLSAYQTVFATEDGSAEMPSAGRPFSHDLITALTARGVAITPLTLHTGVSSLETGEEPYPERYNVPQATADRVNETRRRQGRVIAVGTTVVRALETVSDRHGRVHGGSGWTDLVVAADRSIKSIDGMITGWHEPRSTHIDMLVAVAGRASIAASYALALERGYRWHEFGDSHLIFTR